MSYWMYAVREDGSVIQTKGDSGSLSAAHKVDKNGKKFESVSYDAEPQVGCCMQVGTPFSRTFSNQDWWMTTPVTKIVSREINDDGVVTVVFKTKNSTYKWSN